jgi:hypothetical protein
LQAVGTHRPLDPFTSTPDPGGQPPKGADAEADFDSGPHLGFIDFYADMW